MLLDHSVPSLPPMHHGSVTTTLPSNSFPKRSTRSFVSPPHHNSSGMMTNETSSNRSSTRPFASPPHNNHSHNHFGKRTHSHGTTALPPMPPIPHDKRSRPIPMPKAPLPTAQSFSPAHSPEDSPLQSPQDSSDSSSSLLLSSSERQNLAKITILPRETSAVRSLNASTASEKSGLPISSLLPSMARGPTLHLFANSLFSIVYPSLWTKLDLPCGVLFVAEPTEPLRFRPNLSVLVEDLTGRERFLESLEVYTEAALCSLSSIPEAALMEARQDELAGRPAFSVSYQLDNLIYIQSWLLVRHCAVIVTYTCDISAFPDHAVHMIPLLKSLRIL